MIKKYKKGFTLIELLVVISIISLLTSIVLASINTARRKARDTARIRVAQELQKALALYFSDYGYYPPKTQADLINYLVPKYISKINSEIIYRGVDLENDFRQECTSNCPTYRLGIPLESLDNLVLKSDVNDGPFGGGFDGHRDSCLTGIGTIRTPNLCYGLKP